MYFLLVLTLIHSYFANALLYNVENDYFPSSAFFQRSLRVTLWGLTIISIYYQLKIAAFFLSALLLLNKPYNLHNNQDLKTKKELVTWFKTHVSPVSFKSYVIAKVNYLRSNHIQDSKGYTYGKVRNPQNDLRHFKRTLKALLSKEYTLNLELEPPPIIPIKYNGKLEDLNQLNLGSVARHGHNISTEQIQTTFENAFRILQHAEPVVPSHVLTPTCMNLKHL